MLLQGSGGNKPAVVCFPRDFCNVNTVHWHLRSQISQIDKIADKLDMERIRAETTTHRRNTFVGGSQLQWGRYVTAFLRKLTLLHLPLPTENWDIGVNTDTKTHMFSGIVEARREELTEIAHWREGGGTFIFCLILAQGVGGTQP